MRSGASASTTDRGFTILEVLIALLVTSIMALGVAVTFGIAVRQTLASRNQTSTAVLAAQKMEQLRALTWGFDDSGQNLPVSDTTTDLATVPPGNGGFGLNPSPADTLKVNTPGYVDYLDKRGQWLGTGANPTPGAMYIRRWSIEPLPTNPNNTLVMQVLVTTVQREANLPSLPGPRKRYPEDSMIATVKTRKAK